jgi:transposase-like protein
MTVKKLTDADRKEILDLYRHTGETTSTLAERYGVSNSTISRFLKVTLPEDEYETLIAAKRAARTSGGEEKPVPLVTEDPAPQEPPVPEPVVEAPPAPVTVAGATTPKPIKRQHSSTAKPEIEQPVSADVQLADVQLELLETPAPVAASSATSLDLDEAAKANTIAAMLGEELLDEPDDLDDDEDLDDEDLDDEDLDDEDLDDEDLDDEEEEDERPVLRRHLPVESFVKVLPISEAILPKTCYLVIDRTAELITRPLREFGDLGQIPIQEVQQKTLPVFDNHRVARRFSNKRDRVIKVPDSRMLQKARSQLQAKGITRLLFDGRVYSLSPT